MIRRLGCGKGWYPDGTLEGEESFEDGRLVKGRYWDQNGKPIPKRPEERNRSMRPPR
jgi:antitoxin component YwqK of YwqJK toxin-antitoxin module